MIKLWCQKVSKNIASKDLIVVFKSESNCELFTKTILKPTVHRTLSFSQEGTSVTYFRLPIKSVFRKLFITMHWKKKYVKTSYRYYYLKEGKYVFESKEKVKPTLHLYHIACLTASKHPSPPSHVHTMPRKISNPAPNNLPNKDRWSRPSYYRPSPSSPEAKRTKKKKSKKEAPRKKGKEESEKPAPTGGVRGTWPRTSGWGGGTSHGPFWTTRNCSAPCLRRASIPAGGSCTHRSTALPFYVTADNRSNFVFARFPPAPRAWQPFMP